ncbi:MAG: glycine cleavage system protein GcvH [Candidatus Omnitrophica bacterium]|nr:glycine cleavage system protein GcvH [Candidatus Omnitrophota bacterium]
MEIIEHYYYTKDHEWVCMEEESAMVGITDYAQSSLGDITFVELPTVDTEVEQFEELASVESVKAASDIFSPLGGRIVDVNHNLDSDPGLINRSPYERGWIAKIVAADLDQLGNLMNAEEYQSFLEAEKEE